MTLRAKIDWTQRNPRPQGDADCNLRFQNQWEDDETGLCYNLNRYYDPESGQYLSPDPIGLAGGLRTQGYVHDPTAFVDPMGLAGCPTSPTGAQWNEYLSSKYGEKDVYWDWPKNRGFVYGADKATTLQPGQMVGRLGNENGTFVSPLGTSPEALSLRPGTDTSNLNVYRVIQEIPGTNVGPAAPAFDMPGYGTQYELPSSVGELRSSGSLELITK